MQTPIFVNYPAFKVIITILCAYFIGCFSTGSFLASRKSVDLRSTGSGNTGATNTMRVMGLASGLLTLAGDTGKAMLATLLGYYILGESGLYVAGISVIIGHNYPVFTRFRGGKGVATTLGVLLVIMPIPALLLLLCALILMAITRYVSLSAMIAIGILVIYTLFFHFGQWSLFLFSVLLCVLMLITHRENIKRLLNGTENPIHFGKKK